MPARARARGTSIVEVMVASAIGLLVIASLTTTFASSSRARQEIDQAGQQIENGRYAMELLRDDIQMAGYYGQFTLGGTTPVEVNPCQTAVAGMGWSAANLTIPIWFSAFSQGDALPAGCSLPWLKTGTDVLVVRRANTTPMTVATAGTAANQGNLYIQVSNCPDDTQPFAFAAGSAAAGTFALHKGDCATIADLRKLEVHLYYVGTCSVCTGTPDAIPTLRRLALTGTTMSDEALVDGIEALRVDFALDTNGDGRPDENRKCTSDPAAGTRYCAPDTLASAMALRVYLLARNLATAADYVDDKTYALGLSGTVQPAGHWRRHAYSALVLAMNPSGRREP